MKLFFSIRTQLILLVMAACLLVFTICGGIFLQQTTERYKATQIQHMRNLAQAHLHSFTKIILLDDRDTAADIILSLRSYDYIEQLYLFDMEKVAKFRFQNNQSDIFIEPNQHFSFTEKIESNKLLLYLPVEIAGQPYGWVYIQLSLKHVNLLIEQSIKEALMLIPLVLFISLLAAYLTQLVIARPLLSLRNKLKLVTRERRFDTQLRYKHKNELGQLYSGLNTLLRTINTTQQELMKTNATLEEQVEQRSQKLAQVQKHLSESEKMASLGGLVSGVAHEINTPLGIAVTTNSFMYDQMQEIEEAVETGLLSKQMLMTSISQFRDALTQSDKAIQRVIILLSSFKEVAADHIVDEVRPFNLRGYINEVMTSLSIMIKRKNIEFKIIGQDDITITSYPSAVAQILTNLVNNSVKHAFEHSSEGIITIELEENRDEGLITLFYSDNGCGMNSEVLKNIFEPFYTTKRGSGGIGLGMNIVYGIVQKKLAGSITVESSLGQGTQFIIRFSKDHCD